LYSAFVWARGALNRPKTAVFFRRGQWDELTMREKESLNMGMLPPPRNYKKADMKDWTKDEKVGHQGPYLLCAPRRSPRGIVTLHHDPSMYHAGISVVL
jgi:hypothetical protein